MNHQRKIQFRIKANAKFTREMSTIDINIATRKLSKMQCQTNNIAKHTACQIKINIYSALILRYIKFFETTGCKTKSIYILVQAWLKFTEKMKLVQNHEMNLGMNFLEKS